MIAEVTAAALYAENKQRAAACSIDSTPTSANQEDHVSMAAHAARRLSDMADNLAAILGIELLVAAQGIELRAPHATSPALAAVIAVLREQVPALGADRYMADDMAKATALAHRRRGCTTPSYGSGDPVWQTRLNEVSGRLWPNAETKTQRLRLRLIHPMDTGLANGIPAFYIDRILLSDAKGEALVRVHSYEPISEP
eukprot:gene66046-90372_t